MGNTCDLCRIPKMQRRNGLSIDAGRLWTINVAKETGKDSRPWVVLQPKRHVERLSHLNAGEQAEFTECLAWATDHLYRMPFVRRVHVQLLNEGEPSHIHFHISPTYVQETGNGNPASFLAPPPHQILIPGRSSWLPAHPLQGGEPSSLVSGMLSSTRFARRYLAMDAVYRGLSQMLKKFLPKTSDSAPAEVLVLSWLVILGIGAWLSARSPIGAALFSIVAIYRALDLSTYSAIEVLDRFKNKKKSFERTFAITIVNLCQVLLCCFIWMSFFGIPDLNDDGTPSSAERFWAAFAIVTLRGGDGDGNRFLMLVDVAGTLLSSFLLLIVLAVILSSLASRLHESRQSR